MSDRNDPISALGCSGLIILAVITLVVAGILHVLGVRVNFTWMN